MNQRLQRVEKRLARLDRKFRTLYQRFYARHLRKDRANMSAANNFRMALWKHNKQWKEYKGLVCRLQALFIHRPKGRSAVYLTPRELTKFRSWLKNDFRKAKW